MTDAESGRAELADLVTLHREIDQEVKRLTRRHASRMNCERGCHQCCIDGLTVTRIEAELIRDKHSELLERAAPHPSGACAFLDTAGACRIYDERPSVCRSQGLPLRMLFEDDRGQIAERRDICPLNLDGGPALEDLHEEDCWLLGPFELQLTRLDERFAMAERNATRDGEAPRRIPLRSLFRKGAPSVEE